MRALTKTYLVEGLNQKILLERLNLAKIGLLKVKKIDQKHLQITIDAKDDLKFFAICKKMWYNNLVRVGGFLSPFYLMVKNPTKLISFLLSVLLIIFSENIYLGNLYQGDAIFYQKQVITAFEKAGITKYGLFNSERLKVAESILQEQISFGFLDIQKRGNKAVINLHALSSPPQKIVGQKGDLIAEEDLKILKATVYTGTLLKFEGESVKRGEVIAGAYYLAGEKLVKCELLASISAECTYTYKYQSKFPINDQTVERAILTAKLILGDYEVLSTEYKVSDERVVTVILKYEKILCGG